MWKSTIFLLYLVAILASLAISEITEFDCSDIEVAGGIKFDLSSLNKTKEKATKESTPPTITETKYLINPCAPLPFVEEDKSSSCPKGTYICQIKTNYLKGDEQPRIISIRPVAGDFDDSEDPDKKLGKLDPVKSLANKNDIGSLLITLNGGYYMDEKQQANITFICIKDEEDKDIEDDIVTDYKENTLFIIWKTSAACGKRPEEDKGMSGFTKVIIILIVIVLSYFGFGAAYNYHVYKAHGWDLLPHLDFWRDFPYLISDVFKYLVNSFRTGSRTGYSRI